MSTNITANSAGPQTHLSIAPPSHSSVPPTVQITMVSDFSCPWCYVAHKEIHIALAKVRQTHPHTHFVLEYRPYQIDPTLPGEKEKPMCRIACYKAKFGEEKMKKIGALLKERGKRVGIDFHMAGKTRQTTNAHRLALKAFLMGGEEAQTRMVDALFAAFFEKERDIGCYDYLSVAAETTGLMTAATAKAFLMTDELRDHVNCLIRHSVLQDIKGVPFTIVANQWAIQGAETAESFYRAFDFAATQAETRAPTINFAPPCGGPPANTLATPEGLTDETSTTSGTSAATTPNASQSTFSDGRTPVAV